jgi:methyl-accepting chemotaxis protein
MSWFRNLKTATKLMTGFAVTGVIMGVIGWMGISNMASINANTENIYQVQLVPIMELAVMRGMTHQIRAGVFMALSEKDPNEIKGRVEHVRGLTEQLAAAREKFRPSIRAQEVKDAFKKYEDAAADYNSYRDEKVFKVLLAGQKDQALAAAKEAAPRFQTTIEAINETIKVKDGIAKKKFDESQALYSSSLSSMIGLVIGGLALGLVFAFVISRLISRPLAQTVAMLKDLAQGEGDLTKRLAADGKDEVGEMSMWFNTFMNKLHDIIAQVKGGAGHAANASQELSAATEQLASGAQEQAASLEETAASLEEITGTVKQNADNAKQANQLAAGSRDVAEKGGQVVRDAVRSMAEINQASKKIADIITTIDEIAFQTNLLALNAAVEAARAGEQGRGFAVVASEVRNLAQRSATAAKEIKGLIQDSVQKVEAGSELVNKSGETLTEIVGSVKRVTDIIAEIAAASQEQSTGIDQVNKAVTQMDQVTQANAAQTEELSSTAQSLAAQAAQLQALVGGFKVGRDGQVASKPAATGVPAGKPASVARPVGHERRALDGKPRGMRKTDEPVLAAVPAGNGKGQHKDDGFEEF